MSRFLHYACGMLLTSYVSIGTLNAANENQAISVSDTQFVSGMPDSRAGETNVKLNIATDNPDISVTWCYFYPKGNPKTRFSFQDKIQGILPSGVYDISLVLDDKSKYDSYIIVRPNIEITGDQAELSIDPSEAKNHITYKMLLPDGNEATINEIKNGGAITEGTIEECDVNVAIFHDHGYLVRDISFNGKYTNKWEGDNHIDSHCDFWVNDLPENYQIGISHRAIMKDGTYVFAYETVNGGLKESKTLVTDVNKYHKVENRYADVPESEFSTPDRLYSYAQVFFYDSRDMDGLGFRTTSRLTSNTCYVNIAEPTMRNHDTAEMYVMPGYPSVDNGESGYLREFYNLTVPPLSVKDGKIFHHMYHYTNMGSLAPASYQTGGSEFFLGELKSEHPRFSWFEDEVKDAVYGSTAPILMFTHIWDYKYKSSSWVPRFYGRYGEWRDNDICTLETSIVYGDNTVYEGNYDGFDSWICKYCTSGKPDKTMVATIVNNNTIIDGNTATNKTVITIPGNTDDYIPPTLTMLNFRDKNDMITDRFDKASDGTLEFSASDLQFRMNTFDRPWFECQKLASVRVQYSADGRDEWFDLPVEEDEDMFFAPGFGQFFRGSLSNVTARSDNGWFDLRLTIADSDGNTQVQTLSPAFRIEELASLSENLQDKGSVKVDVTDGVLIIEGASSTADVTIYSVDGKKVMQFTGTSADVTSLSGLYLIEVAESMANRTIVKVVM